MVERAVKSEQAGDLFLPPGFRFHPTDEEVITSYLLQKFLNPSFSVRAVGEVDLNKCEPWDLPSKATMGEKEWYFFCHKDMKYPTGMRANRATKEGYWKATGKDREILGAGRELVGMKKTLVFYMGRAPRGTKTNWVMHEYRLEGKSRHNNANLRFNPKDEWVVCKVFNKKGEAKKNDVDSSAGTPDVSSVEAGEGDDDGFLDSMIDSMFLNSANSLPNTTTMNAAADYSISSTGAAATSGSSSSWNMLHADDALGSYSLQHQQAAMVKSLGGVISPNFGGGLPLPSLSVTGNLQQNSLRNYGGRYATHLTSSAIATATAGIGPAAKNLGRGVVRY